MDIHLKCFYIFVTVVVMSDGTFQQPAADNPLPDVFVRSTNEQDFNIKVTEKNDYVIPSGHNFTIECHGSYPPVLKVVRRNKVEIEPNFFTLNISKVRVNSSRTRAFEVHYHVYNTDYTYTGLYQCYYADNENLGTSVYIYMSDQNHLFAPTWTQFLFLSIYHYRKTYLPCRVTDPAIPVKLYNSIGPTEIELGDATAVTYDPELGFILHYPNRYFEGQFECVAKAPSGEEETLIMVLRYLGSTSVPQPALVTANTTVGLGNEFDIQCRVYVDRGVVLSMEWSYSSNERSDRLHYTAVVREEQKTGSYVYDLLYSNFTVMNAQKSDEGVYLCKVTTHDGKQNNVSTSITIVDQEYIYLSPVKPDVYGEEGRSVMIIAEYDGFPQPTITWWSGNRKLVNILNEIHIETTKIKTSYNIRKVEKNMAGIYTVKAENSLTTAKDIKLIVKYKPEIQLTTNRVGAYFVLNNTYTLKCKVDCVPTVDNGDIWWEFSPCDFNSCGYTATRQWKNLSEAGLKGSFDFQEDSTSQLTFIATQIGIIRCVARNEVGNSSRQEHFKISEMNEGLDIAISNIRPIEEDQIVIKCYATLWVYRNVDIFYREDGSELLLPIYDTNRTKISKYRTKLSLTVELVINLVVLTDTGNYVCQGEKSNVYATEFEINAKKVTVRAIVKPHWVDGQQHDTRIIINEGISEKVANCEIVGIPTPTFRWYKDGKLIDEDKNTLGIYFSHDFKSLHINETSKVHEGVYTCEATNRGGVAYSSWTLSVGFVKKELQRTQETEIIVSVVVVAIVIIIIIVVIICFWYRRKTAALHKELRKLRGDYNLDIPINEQRSCFPYDPKCDFPKKRLRKGTVLGQGSFGRVIKAEAIGIQDHEDVSVVTNKLVKDCTDEEQDEA